MKLKARWSLEALDEFEEIYEYWIKRNKSNTYLRKLWNLTNKAIQIIEIDPMLGIQTNQENVRMRLIANNYYLIYKIGQDYLEILKFWDVRQNPSKNEFIYGR
jgi:hypothetical protein